MVNTIKLLGIAMSYALDWIFYGNHVCHKVKSVLGAIEHMRHIINSKTSGIIFHTCIKSHVLYFLPA